MEVPNPAGTFSLIKLNSNSATVFATGYHIIKMDILDFISLPNARENHHEQALHIYSLSLPN